MLNTIETQNREARIRAQVMVHEDHVKKTNPKMRATPQIPDQAQSVPTPAHKPEETSSATKTNSTKGNGYMFMYILLTVGAGVAAGLLFTR